MTNFMFQNKSNTKLDKKDLQLLYELDVNARRSYQQLGKRVRLNKNSVNYRITRLMKDKIILGFYTEVDMYKIGFTLYRLFLRLQNLTTETEMELIAYFVVHQHVGWVFSVEGKFDIAVGVYFKNNQEFKEFETKVIDKFSSIIEDKLVSIFTRMHQFKKSFLIDNAHHENNYTTLGNTNNIPIDRIDQKILNAIVSNSRLSSLEIGNKIGVKPNIIAYRIKKLIESKIILGFRVMLNFDLLGIEWYKLHIKTKNMDANCRKKMYIYFSQNPYLAYLNETIGGFDIEPEFYAFENKQIREFIERLRKKFPENIKDFELLHYFKTHKQFMYLPLP